MQVKCLLGQSPSLQGMVSLSSLPQSAPPFDGAGLVHVLVLVLVPSPQVTEQDPGDHGVQLPSTVM